MQKIQIPKVELPRRGWHDIFEGMLNKTFDAKYREWEKLKKNKNHNHARHNI